MSLRKNSSVTCVSMILTVCERRAFSKSPNSCRFMFSLALVFKERGWADARPAPRVRFGSNSEIRTLKWEVRFAPINGHRKRDAACPKSATKRTFAPAMFSC